MTGNRYQNYLDSLPRGWARERVRSLGQVVGGGTPSRAVPVYWDGDIPWITPGELEDGGVKRVGRTRDTITAAGLTASGAVLLPAGALLVTTRATLGRRALTERPMATNQGFKSVVFDGRSLPDFYFHLADRLKGEITRRASGTTFLEISGSQLSDIEVPVPPFREQRRIAEILDGLDDLVAVSERLIRKQSRLAVGIERAIFKQLRHSAGTSLDQLALVDRGRFTARPRNDPAFYGGPYPFAQTGDVSASSRGLLTSASQSLNERGRRVSRSFPRGSIAVTIAANIADTAILHRETYFPDSVVGVVPHDLSTARWIEMCIHQHKPRLEAIAPQSAQKNINLEDLRPLAVPNVAVEDRRRFGAVYEQCDRVLTAERARLAKLTALRAGIADDLLTGRIRTVPE
jgi:type I restriction enzyme S subunit